MQHSAAVAGLNCKCSIVFVTEPTTTSCPPTTTTTTEPTTTTTTAATTTTGIRQQLLPERRYVSAGATAMALCLCLSRIGVLSKRLDGLVWFLAPRLLLTSCFIRKFKYLQNKGTSPWNFFLNAGLTNLLFRHGISVVGICY